MKTKGEVSVWVMRKKPKLLRVLTTWSQVRGDLLVIVGLVISDSGSVVSKNTT